MSRASKGEGRSRRLAWLTIRSCMPRPLTSSPRVAFPPAQAPADAIAPPSHALGEGHGDDLESNHGRPLLPLTGKAALQGLPRPPSLSKLRPVSPRLRPAPTPKGGAAGGARLIPGGGGASVHSASDFVKARARGEAR